MPRPDPVTRLVTSAVFKYTVPAFLVAVSLVATLPLASHGFRIAALVLSIIVSAWVGGLWPGLLAVLLSTISIALCLNAQGSPVTACPAPTYSIPNIVAFLAAALLVASWSASRRRAENGLRQARDELEARVQERTADLSRSNDELRQEIAERKRTEAELRTQKEILQKVFDNVPVMIGLRDEKNKWFLVNREWERQLGWTLDEIKAQNVDIDGEIYPDPKERQRVLDFRAASTGGWTDFQLTAKDGRTIDVTLASIRLSDGTSIGIAKDITERKRAEEANRQQGIRSQLIADISQACAEAGLDVERVLQTIVRRTAELTDARCIVFQVTEDQQRFKVTAFYDPNPEALARMREMLGRDWSGSLDAPIPKRLAAGEAVWLPVVKAEDFRSSFPSELWPFLERFGISSLLAVPLRLRGQVIGSLGLERMKAGPPPTEFDKVLLQDLADRAAFAIENARLYQSANEKREQLRALRARLVETQEAERRTMARELHNEIGQALTGLQYSLQLIGHLTPQEAGVKLEEAQSMVTELLGRVQNLSLDLRPAVLDDLGLGPALLWQFSRYTQQTGIRVRFDHRGIGRRFAPEIETAVYRIVQEGLTNVARYAHVAEAAVHVWVEDGSLGLQVEDKGVGFDVQAALAAHRSSGLSGLQEQAELLGGELSIESSPGGGTVIVADLPVAHSPSEEQGEHVGEDSAGG